SSITEPSRVRARTPPKTVTPVTRSPTPTGESLANQLGLRSPPRATGSVTRHAPARASHDPSVHRLAGGSPQVGLAGLLVEEGGEAGVSSQGLARLLELVDRVVQRDPAHLAVHPGLGDAERRRPAGDPLRLLGH